MGINETLDRWDDEDRKRIGYETRLKKERELLRSGKIDHDEVLRIQEARDRAEDRFRALSLIENARRHGEDPSQYEALLEYLNNLGSIVEDSRSPSVEAQTILSQYGVTVFGEKPGKVTMSEISVSKVKISQEIPFVSISDLSPGEGGFTTAWTVGNESAPIERISGGTLCIPVWRDTEGNIGWDAAKVAAWNAKYS